METKFIARISVPTNFDMEKIKVNFSSLGEVKERASKLDALRMKVLTIPECYNDTIYLDEVKQEVHLNIKIEIVECGFIAIIFTIDKKLNIKGGTSDILSAKREFKNKKFDSFNAIVQEVTALMADFQTIMQGMLDVDAQETAHVRYNTQKKLIENNSCLKVFTMAGFLISQSYSSTYYKINKAEDLPEESSSYEKIFALKKCQVFKRPRDNKYYIGDSGTFDVICIDEFLIKSKLQDCIRINRSILEDINNKASKIIDRLNIKNPLYWEKLSQDIEHLQLCYIAAQNWIGDITSKICITNYDHAYGTGYYAQFISKIKQLLLEQSNLSSEIDSALINISTPIKSRNEFKLQESTDKVNDRILFLSFIAMSIPLISYLISDSMSFSTKISSIVIIVCLPLLYILSNKLFKKRQEKLYVKNNLEDDLQRTDKSIEEITSNIEYLNSALKEDTNLDFPILKILENALIEQKNRKTRLEKELKSY